MDAIKLRGYEESNTYIDNKDTEVLSTLFVENYFSEVKELNKQITQLEDENFILKREIENLRNKLINLESRY